MRFVWVDEGNDADWESPNGLDNHHMTGAFFSVREPEADLRRRLLDTKDRGKQGGCYAAWNWWPETTSDGAAFAEKVSGLVKTTIKGLPGTSNAFPKVQLNNERHEPDEILAMLRRWRQLQPQRDTSWTFESMQGGWMSPAFVSEVLSLRIRLVPQAYTGRMADLELPAAMQLEQFRGSLIAQDVVLRDLLRRGLVTAP